MPVWFPIFGALDSGEAGTSHRREMGQEDTYCAKDDKCLWRNRICWIWRKYWKGISSLYLKKDFRPCASNKYSDQPACLYGLLEVLALHFKLSMIYICYM